MIVAHNDHLHLLELWQYFVKDESAVATLISVGLSEFGLLSGMKIPARCYPACSSGSTVTLNPSDCSFLTNRALCFSTFRRSK
jgi:hypothetical protein